MIEALRRRLRPWLPEDITLLAWPDNGFQHAHLWHLICYGRSVYLRDRAAAEARHREWTRKGYTLTFRRNWRGKVYIHAEKP